MEITKLQKENENLKMENTAIRLECRSLMKENNNLKTALIASNALRNQDITKLLVEAVVKSYYEGKDLASEIEIVKKKLEEDGKLKFMSLDFKKASKEQLGAEEIYKEQGVS